jgi:hypothetical protein
MITTTNHSQTVLDLAMMVRRLSYALKRAGTDDKLVMQSVALLKLHELGGSIIRTDAAIEKECKHD